MTDEHLGLIRAAKDRVKIMVDIGKAHDQATQDWIDACRTLFDYEHDHPEEEPK